MADTHLLAVLSFCEPLDAIVVHQLGGAEKAKERRHPFLSSVCLECGVGTSGPSI